MTTPYPLRHSARRPGEHAHYEHAERAADASAERRTRWLGIPAAAAVIVALTWLAAPRDPPAPWTGSAETQRGQAQQTFAVFGYSGLSGLTLDGDGSWRASARKDGSDWSVRLSPGGAVTASAKNGDVEVTVGGSSLAAPVEVSSK